MTNTEKQSMKHKFPDIPSMSKVDERTVRMGDEGPLHNKNREVIAACPSCAHAVKRVEHLFNEASRLGLDYPTDKMLEDMVRDAEWNALWNPREIAEQHDQDMREMASVWNRALNANIIETVMSEARLSAAICLNCGEIQQDQFDRICVVCQRRDLTDLAQLRSAVNLGKRLLEETGKP